MKLLLVVGAVLILVGVIVIRAGTFDSGDSLNPSLVERVMVLSFLSGVMCEIVAAIWWSVS